MIPDLLNFEFQTIQIDSSLPVQRPTARMAQYFLENLSPGIDLEMVHIPYGEFLMGAPDDEAGRRENETPVRLVKVPNFYLGKYSLTQDQWRSVMGELPPMDREFVGGQLPVVNVWLEFALEFLAKLSQKSGRRYRLPSEAEWEYARRAGSTTSFNCGETILIDLANFDGTMPYGNQAPGDFRGRTTTAGHFGVANDYGVCDLHGNVWEWCADAWHEDYSGAPNDGSAWIADGDQGYRVQRGGCWKDPAAKCRSAFRVGDVAHNSENIVGLRVCLSA